MSENLIMVSSIATRADEAKSKIRNANRKDALHNPKGKNNNFQRAEIRLFINFLNKRKISIACEYLEKNGVDCLYELIARTEKEEKTNHKCSKTTLACRMVFRNPVKKVAGKKPTAVVQSPKKILNKQICESCNCL